jgi:anti-sigma factor RsiW
MDCNHVQLLLPVYIDNELSATESMELERHLQDCKPCQHVYNQDKALHHALTRLSVYHQAPIALTDSVRYKLGIRAGQLARPAKVNARKRSDWPRVGAAFASLFVTGLAIYMLLPTVSDVAPLSQELVAGYARSMITNHTTDVESSDRHTVKPWFSGKLDYAPAVFDLTEQGFPLIGGRLDYINQQPVAVMVYRHRQHLINLYTWPAKAGKLDSIASMTMMSLQGYHILFWTQSAMRYGLISDLNPADLTRLKTILSHQLEK